MLSDSSQSDMVFSPLRNKRRLKKQRVSSSESESEEENPKIRAKVSHSLRIFSSGESSDDEESPIKRCKRARRERIVSSSSDSVIAGPSRMNISRTTIEDSDDSDSSDSDEVARPWQRKVLGRKEITLFDPESSDSEVERLNSRKTDGKEEASNSSDSDGSEKCIICFKTLGTPYANPSNCNHSFHEECLSTWSKTSNTCPIDRVKYTSIYIRSSSGKVINTRNVNTPPPQDHNPDLEPDDPTFCKICNQHDRESEMLLCDRCEDGYHMDCLNPPLFEVPSGDWFCPDCTIRGHGPREIDDDEIRDLMAGSVILETRLRRERERQQRDDRVHPRTRAAQRILNTIRRRANVVEEPPTVSERRKKSQTLRKKPKKKHRTRYKVELITADDGTTVEVKVAIRSGKYKRRKRKIPKKSKLFPSLKVYKEYCKGGRKPKNGAQAARESHSGGSDFSLNSLDLFGSRPQLDYFSGCEAEDELEEDGGGLVGLRRARTVVRGMAERKQIAAQILASRPRRVVPKVITSTPSVDILSTILQDQEKLHNPRTKHSPSSGSSGSGKLLKTGPLPVKKAPGSKAEEQKATSSQPQNTEGSTNGSGEATVAEAPPLQPPPQPPFARLYDDDDIDLYADIEPPTCRLAPPPEPPPLLLAMEGEEGGSSPEDTMLVIDDQRDVYDPEEPTSPPSPDSKKQGAANARSPQTPNADYPKVNLEDIQLPSPVEADNDSDCPNAVMYSKTSRNIARRGSTDSESLVKDDEEDTMDELPLKITESLEIENNDDEDEKKYQDSIDMVKEMENNLEEEKVPSPEEPKEESDTSTEDVITETENVSEPIELEKAEEKEGVPEDSTDVEINKTETKIDDDELLSQKMASMKWEEDSESRHSENEVCEETKIEETDESPKDTDKDVNDEEVISKNETEDLKNPVKDEEKETLLKDEDHLDEEEDTKVAQTKEKEENDTEDSEQLNESQLTTESIDADDSKRSSDGEKECEKEQETDVLELGCEEGDRDGLVDITDEEMSTYEKNWEMENDKPPTEKKIGLEGLETEAISECEDTLNDDAPGGGKNVSETTVGKEEGEIIVEERSEPITWKKLSKGTKERSYREKEAKKENKEKKKEKKPKEKRKELERYDVRKIISDKPKKRKTDEFGRDISNSRSRSLSARSGSRARRRRSREKRKTRSRGRTRSRSRERSRARSRVRSRGRSRSKSRSRKRSRSKSRGRTRSRSRFRSWSRGRSRSRSRRRLRSRSLRREKNRERVKSKERKRRRKSSSSCSSCSCSSCERERRGTKKLTVIVPNKSTPRPRKGKEKKKEKGKEKRKDSKRRKVTSPIPSKEVFTSGDNILVSVNFKSSKSGDVNKVKEGPKRKRDEESRRKKDKGSKENQPLRSIVTTTVSVPPNMPRKKKDRTYLRNLKPVAIIDLDQSPFREQTPSPKEVIILSDSDSENKRQNDEPPIQPITTGPKTPPEPHIKFSISAKPQIRNLSNPLLDSNEAEEREGDEEEQEEISHKGPNTPPEPPVPYDPFEPTKSRSPTPCPDMDDHIETNPSPPAEIMNICISRITPEPPKSVSPPKILQHDSPKTPSPLQSPQKPPEEILVEKPKPVVYTPAMTTNCSDDVMDIGGGDSPYSPGTSEAEDLFEPPLPQITTPTPIAKVKPRPIPPQKHTNTLKLTPSPLKKRPLNNKGGLKNNKGNSGKKEIGIKLDEDQLKILDELPNSAVEMQVKDKFLKKLNRQERVVEEVKMVLKPHYAKKHVTKEEYKEILRKSVPKICHNRSGEINPIKIQHLVEAYVKKYRHRKKKNAASGLLPSNMKPKPKQTMWC